jgi:outer membrane protein W
MKKGVLLLSVLAVLAISVEAFAEAPKAEGLKFAIGARVGHNFYRDGNTRLDSSAGSLGNMDYSNKSAWMYGINGTAQFNEYFSVELGVDRTIASESNAKIGGVSYKLGDGTQTPLTLTGRIHYPVGIFSPYVGAGFGYYFRSFDKDNSFFNPAATVKVDDGWGYHVNAGTEIFITEARNIALNLDFKYVWAEANLTASNGPVWIKGTMKFDSFITGIGIKYYF